MNLILIILTTAAAILITIFAIRSYRRNLVKKTREGFSGRWINNSIGHKPFLQSLRFSNRLVLKDEAIWLGHHKTILESSFFNYDDVSHQLVVNVILPLPLKQVLASANLSKKQIRTLELLSADERNIEAKIGGWVKSKNLKTQETILVNFEGSIKDSVAKLRLYKFEIPTANKWGQNGNEGIPSPNNLPSPDNSYLLSAKRDTERPIEVDLGEAEISLKFKSWLGWRLIKGDIIEFPKEADLIKLNPSEEKYFQEDDLSSLLTKLSDRI